MSTNIPPLFSSLLFKNATWIFREIATIVTFFKNSLLQDVNDEVPTFSRPSYAGEIRENAQKGTPITFLGVDVATEVFDYDRGSNGTFNLHVEGDQGIFEACFYQCGR